MINVVEKFLDEFGLKSADNNFLIGFSGGYDSLCMLDILNELSRKYGFKIIALHLNHNWRGEESRQEELNCKNFCEKTNIEFISETLENGQKTESFAREARYNFFLKYARKYPNSSIFTAHTRTDNKETIIYRIIKGTGIKGLQGIPPKRMLEEIPLYRPILSFSRKEIEDYCNSKGLVPNTDSSNFDVTYKRNFIRLKIMPLFEEINFHAEKAIISLSKIAISQTNIINEYMDLIKKDIFEDSKILTSKFKNLSEDVKKKIIYDICSEQNYSTTFHFSLKENKLKLDYDSKKIDDILEFINNNLSSKAGSRHSLTNDLWLFASSKYIYLITKIKVDKNRNEISISQEGGYEIPGTNRAFSLKKYTGNNFKFPGENALTAYVNLDNIGLDLTIRTRRDGDFIIPFGMTGSMKLKKYLNSKGISQHNKDELILLCKDSEILWVAGVGLSNKLKVVNTPSHVLELKNK